MLVGLWPVPSAAQAPSIYDLRSVTTGSSSLAWVPAIQDQGFFSDCWTFAAATAIESNLLKNGFLPAAAALPPMTVSSWHLSAFNGGPEPAGFGLLIAAAAAWPLLRRRSRTKLPIDERRARSPGGGDVDGPACPAESRGRRRRRPDLVAPAIPPT
jgi:hypothetical protein